MTTKIDWGEAKVYYFSSQSVSYRDVAKKFGVSRTSVQEHAGEEGWPEARQRLIDQASEKFQQKLLGEREQTLGRHLQHFRNIQALVSKTVQGIDDANYLFDDQGKVVTDENGDPIRRRPNAYEVRALSQTLKVATEGERLAMGLPTSLNQLQDPDGKNPLGGLFGLFAEAKRIVDEQNASPEPDGAESTDSE